MEVKKKISKKQTLINKIMKEKNIRKGLSKLPMKELKDFDDRGLNSSDWLDTIGGEEAFRNRKSILTLMTRKKLLKIVSAVRIKNYSHLKHQDLINLIANKYWGDFHSRWLDIAREDENMLPDWYYGVNNESLDNPRKIGRKKKGKKEEVKEEKHDEDEGKHDEVDSPLKYKQYVDEIRKYKNYTIKELGEIQPKELKDIYEYIRDNKNILYKIKGDKKKNILRIISKIEKNMKKVLEDDKKCLTSRQKKMLKEATHNLSYYLDKSNLDKNRKKRTEDVNTKLDYVYKLMKQIDYDKCKDTKLYKDFMKVYDKIHSTDTVKNGVWKTIWKDLNVIHPSKGIIKDRGPKKKAPKRPERFDPTLKGEVIQPEISSMFEITPNTLKEFLENEKKFSSNEPVEYTTSAVLQPFLMISVLKRTKNDCSAGVYFDKSKYKEGVQSMINITATNKQIKPVSNEMIKIIANAYLRCKTRNKMLVLPLRLPGHSNMLIFNYHRNEIERFEPHGGKTGIKGLDSEKINTSIENRFVKKLNTYFSKNEQLKFIPPTEVCPTGFKGFQSYEQKAPRQKTGNVMIEDPQGFCSAWSYFYAYLRIKFPKPSASELTKNTFEILKTEPQQLRTFIRGQVGDAMKMFKDAVGEKLYKKIVDIGMISDTRRGYYRGKNREERDLFVKDYNDTFHLLMTRLDEYFIKEFKKYTSDVEPVKEDEPVEEKKQEEMTTKEGTKKLKEIVSSKVSSKTKTKQALNTLFTTMKGDIKFYKENKAVIDKLTSIEYRKKMNFE